ncbi:MAG: serine/threonine protein kinase [Polyangiaceae bacterium]|nr:serine/threonine protein kinase [Polyangiaceae bacterium]
MSFEPPDLTGAILSQKYRLTKRIGYGGMGAVYTTESVADSGERIAIKILNPDCLENKDVVERFVEEGRTCQRLLHANIVRVFDVSVAENGCPYLVMELLNGVPLSAYTMNGGRVPLTQCVTIVQGLLAGLTVAHAQGVVHRDLKPENVFLARDAKGAFLVKILDFGIAKVMDLAGGMGKRTRTGVLLGTPAYMSPEQIKSTKDVDARSDLFSVGVMTYEMLTGRPAFPAPTEYAKLAAVLNSEPPPLETIDPSFLRLSAFVQRAMQKDRDKRFQSANEMGRALGVATGTTPEMDFAAARLSHLPEVPSMYRPPVNMTPGGSFSNPNPSLVMPQQQQIIIANLPDEGSVAPGGTLTSRKSTTESLPAIRPSNSGTLPSNDIPILEPVSSGAPRLGGASSPGVRPMFVALFCMISLLVGLGLGLFIGRM